MTKDMNNKMTTAIAKQIANVMKKGATYTEALDIVYDAINSEWPEAMAAYCNQ